MRTVTAVARAVDILDIAARASDPPRVAAIALALGIPRNTAYELIHTLVERQLLRLTDDGRVVLGVRLFEFGARYSQSVDLLAEGREIASTLRDASGETVHVATLSGCDAVYLVKEESRHAVRMSSAIGMRLPAHVTGVGKAMLAALPDSEFERLFAAATLEVLTPNSISTIEGLVRDLEATRARGYAVDHEESSPDVACVAAVIRDGSGGVAAGISISAPVSRLDASREPDLARMVMAAADELSRRLGYLREPDLLARIARTAG